MGTITLDVGESYSIDGEAGGAQAQSGYWSVDGDSIFSITAKSQKQCTIRAYKAGTSRLKTCEFLEHKRYGAGSYDYE